MADIEKVIKGVEHCFHGQEGCGETDCPYWMKLGDCDMTFVLDECQENLKKDVLELLKKRQATKGEVM